MNRYRFLTKESTYKALNKLRTAFLAAKDLAEVDEIIKGILTDDELLKIGRRILISDLLNQGYSIDKIRKIMKVGKHTILRVKRKQENYPLCFELINKRIKKGFSKKIQR